MRYRLGELFCGPGGMGLGAIRAKVTKDGDTHEIIHEWATDYDKDTCDTYSLNFTGIEDSDKSESVICKDVRKLEIKKDLSPIDGFAFGFPCNDFSLVGKQKGITGEFGPLYSYGVKVLNEFKPMWFVAENVGGIQSSNDGEAFRKILDELQLAGKDTSDPGNTGYNIFPHKYKFEYYGIPQKRHRIIIVGIWRGDGRKFKIPKPTHPEEDFIGVKKAIEEPPIKETANNHVFTKQSKTVVERLMHIKPGENAFNSNLPEHLKLNVKGAKLSQIYKRLVADEPSYTVTGSGGGGTHVYHWKEPRALTNRERARLQTFPDDFIFLGNKESIRKQIGMAVPPRGAEVIFNAILKTFAGIPYEHVEPNINHEVSLFY